MNSKTIIGVVYLKPSLGHVDFIGESKSIDFAISQVEILKEAGFSGALLENEWDRPYSIKMSPEVISFATKLCLEVRKAHPQFDIGIEFLINDPHASLAVAKNCGLNFIRSDYYVDKMFRPEYGELDVDLEDFKRFRKNISSEGIAVYTDIQVKYAKMIEERPIEDSAIEAKKKGSDGLIISSEKTGVGPSLKDLEKIKDLNLNIPSFIGSGLNCENARTLLPLCQGAMVGSSIMHDGVIEKELALKLIDSIK